MSKQPTIKGQLAKEYCDKFPRTANLTLAKKLYKENKSVFTDIEDARNKIRYVRDASGKKHREQKGERSVRLYEIPESAADNWSPFFIPKSIRKLGILCDVHIPYHDVNALKVACEHMQGVDGILLNGDLLDFYALSRFEKDPRARSFAEELEAGRQFLGWLKQEFNVPIYYKLGNHEERYQKYLMNKAPELLDIEEFRLEVLLRCAEMGVTVIQDKRIIKHGYLDILHGHEFFGAPSQAVNPARGVFMKTMESCLIGHLHKSSSHTETTLQGRMITTNSIGCLCHLTPEYARINKWNHGFAISELTDGANYVLHNKRIFKGKVL